MRSFVSTVGGKFREICSWFLNKSTTLYFPPVFRQLLDRESEGTLIMIVPILKRNTEQSQLDSVLLLDSYLDRPVGPRFAHAIRELLAGRGWSCKVFCARARFCGNDPAAGARSWGAVC